ncbi:bacteriocin immunity protein [Pantoea septica]|uniref:bacteriocin immunity protein n=1 Tax=Pantoea septica TaxID=472695 RepID=UPI00289D794E|nr:bacteriocin immunity protein [Pantoea septica]
MILKPKFEEYTEAEFTQLVTEICSAGGSEDYQEKLLENFIKVTEHPDGSDLIYCTDNDDLTPEKIVITVREWRNKQGLCDLRP